jgi:ectoine hydroxylase-related dioxygenase (phytanoyl-CoA dioxygenase family)
MSDDHLEHYQRDGYAVVRGVFGPEEVAELAGAFDRIYRQGLCRGRSYRDHNVFFRLTDDPAMGPIVRMVQWPSYFDPVMARYRTHPKLLRLLEPLLGSDLKQIINQLHWKPPGAAQVDFAYHQDIRSRRPRQAYRAPTTSYVQTGIAIDPHDESNGAMLMLPGSHRLGELCFDRTDHPVMNRPLANDDLRAVGLDPASCRVLRMEPGDVALWHLHLVHGSGPNHSTRDRRFFLNGYVIAANCDRGEWAFRDGKPCALGEPVLVHYEDLYSKPGPFYVD